MLPGGKGRVLSPKWYMDVPAGPQKSYFLHTNFLPYFPPISIPFLKAQHPVLTKLGTLYNNLPKIHPIYVIWAPSSLMKTPIAIPNYAKSAPKGRHHIHIPCQCENPPECYIAKIIWIGSDNILEKFVSSTTMYNNHQDQ